MEEGNPIPWQAAAGRLLTVGWREYLAFPEWDIRRMKVKIDTGARTSALGVASYDLRQVDGQGLVVDMRVIVNSRRSDRIKVVHAPVLRMLAVCSTSGLREVRPLVETTIRLGPVTKRVQLTITNRTGMRFRMILGRKALEGDFVVDVSKQYLLRP
jgi:hypothetical protein